MKKILYLVLISLFSSYAVSFAQDNGQISVAGTVMDEKGNELPGVSIMVKGNSKKGTSSNTEGKFRIENLGQNSVLLFSYIGFENLEYTVAGSKDKLKIVLKEKLNSFDEVQVVAYGTQRKVTQTGAISTINVKDLQVPATSLSNMLGGRVPGIIAVTRSGEPGSDFSEFWVRGISTFGASSSALILIDGVEGNLNNVDPSDIESFSILKDASATAVYGVRGANGVVVITTKRGKAGNIKLNFRANSTLSHSARMPEYADASLYAELANEARVVRGLNPVYSPVEMELFKTGLDPDLYPNTNWRDIMLKDYTRYSQYNLNISGGGTNARYYMSLGYLNKEGIFKQDPDANKYDVNTNYKKYNFRANIDVDLTKTTKMALNLDNAITLQNSPAFGTDNRFLWTSQANITPVSTPLRYSNGQLAGFGSGGTSMTPYSLLNYTGFRKTNENNVNAKLSLEQDLKFVTEGLTARGLFSWTYFGNNGSTLVKIGEESFLASGRANDGSLVTSRTITSLSANYAQSSLIKRQMYMEGQLNYNRMFNSVHNVTGLLHVYRQEDITSDVDAYSDRYMSIIPLRYQALSGRATYSFKDTYLLEANVGYSGSENFEPGAQYGLFPALSAGWIPTQYDWMKRNAAFIDYLKIRGSWGKVGNAKITNNDNKLVRFPYQTILNVEGNDWGTTIAESKVGTKGLKWQTSTKYDLGIDAKLFNNKIDFTVDAFLTKADDIYQQRLSIPDEVGAPQAPYLNVGSMKSWGLDGNLSYNQTVTKDLSFTLKGNFTFARNKVTHWEQTGINFPYQSFTNVPFGVQRGLIALGLFKDQADIANSPTQTFTNNYMPGDIKYRDVNGDGVVNTDDIVPLDYSSVPRVIYGFATSVSWKKWSFNVFFTGQDQVSYFLGGSGYYPFQGGATGNILNIVGNQGNRWTPASYSGTTSTENPNARFPRLTYGVNENNNRASTFWTADASFLRLKNAEIAYRWDSTWLKRYGISSATFSLVGDNLAVWDKVKLWDPEQASDNGAVYPLQRMYTLQMFVSF
ncbi:TonB-linked outer membrane protein, SusC/RagA family [Pedobacter sp. ok626]|uniref:SusC/RagA family TonB-linked outer membrane protein n=1 Tax=Pedobacter sp. ok626 TaxID=1761882 RepID=UPI00088A6865|nr:TonB-dependent receptor [Pedobacter sp. ok626]SDL55370.1 TonB-linked outer membrane protein, SusC/RagA family [Pedobacter sp. ok626]